MSPSPTSTIPEDAVVTNSLASSPRPKARFFNGTPIPRSGLPFYAVNEKDPQDKLYTKRSVARHCYRTFNRVAKTHGYHLRRHVYIEPSAGQGCFTDLLPEQRRISLDIDPQAAGIQQADFLRWQPSAGKFVVIGNPPFGVRGATALGFINRAGLFADIVAFILPMTFASDGKGGAMTRVKNLHLLHSEELESDSFYAADGNTRGINTVFQVWGSRLPPQQLRRHTCAQYVELITVCTNPIRRCGTHRIHECAFFIQGTFYDNKPPVVVTDFAKVKYASGYGVIIKKRTRDITRILKQADWSTHSSRATNHCHHIRMQHIRDVLISAGIKDDKSSPNT